MSVGKYSPTVSFSYMKDQKWFEKNGGDFGNGVNPDSIYDNDGFDSYGYNSENIDRAGIHENDYMRFYTVLDDELEYTLYNDTYGEWCFKIIDKKENHNTLMESNEKYSFHFNKLKEINEIIEKAEKLRNESLSIIEIEMSKALDTYKNAKK
jgi:hypothetical protein